MSESKEAWLIAENARLTKENEQLMKDVHRIDSARQAAFKQCAAMAEEIWLSYIFHTTFLTSILELSSCSFFSLSSNIASISNSALSPSSSILFILS